MNQGEHEPNVIKGIIKAQARAREPRSTDINQPPHDPEDGIEVLQEKGKDEQKKVKDY